MYENVFEWIFRISPQTGYAVFDLVLPIGISILIYQSLKTYLETILRGKGLIVRRGHDVGLRMGMIYICVWTFHFILGYWHLTANLVFIAILMILLLSVKPLRGV